MTDDSSNLPVDESARQRFESSWRRGEPASIEQCLPPVDNPAYLGTLEELVHIDLEFQWKRGAFDQQKPARVEDYLSRFTELRTDEIIRRLVRQECRVRHQFGQPPAPGELSTRFPHLFQGQEAIDVSMDRSVGSETVAPDQKTEPKSFADAGPAYSPPLQGYQIIDRLGEGAMGVVWKAVQLSTKRTVAVKMMSAASFGSERARIRFEREVELTASLDHPNIARVFDSGVRDGIFFYSMELVDGVPLDEYVKTQKLSRVQIVSLMEQVCRAMQHAHYKGVIHRDLKPSNILVDTEGRPHILDFGLAKIAQGDQQISIDGDIAGTPAYMSPEQAAGHVDKLDTRSDVYTLGVILFFLLSGQYPHDTSGTYLELLRRIAEEDARRITDIHPKIDGDLAALLGHALERDPDRRYGAAGTLAADLQRFLNGDTVLARPPSATYRLRKRIRKHRKPLAIAAIFLALIVGISGYLGYDYYLQWGDWIEVANYDFRSGNSSTDGLDFVEGGFTLAAAPAWPAGKEGMTTKYGQWCVLKDVHLRGDVRIVLNVAFGDRPDGVEMCLNSVGAVGLGASPAGYSAQVGGYGGQIDYISRNERNAGADETEAIAGGILPRRVAVITFQRQGEKITLQVDKEPPIETTQLLPLIGVGLDRVAIRSWSGDTVIRSMAVYRRSLPRKASPVAAGDALVEAGVLDAALRQYENLADDYPHSTTGETALAKACTLAGAIRPSDPARTRRLRDRFAADYPRSEFRHRLLESEVLDEWQAGDFDQALEKLQQVFRLDPKTRLPLRLVAAAHGRPNPLPAGIAQKLMASVRKVSGVSRLNVSGLGIESLVDVARPELRTLYCWSNPISSLEPLRGIALERLNCSKTRVSSLEPLRCDKLNALDINGTNITDLEPLRGMPLANLACNDCSITNLDPLRGRRTLEHLDIRRTRVSSLEPLRGLALKTVNIGGLRVPNLDVFKGMPLQGFGCDQCGIASLEALRGAPLIEFQCSENQIETLEPLRGMKLVSVECHSNHITTLEPLRGMPLQSLTVRGNLLTSLEPLVENPPSHFYFDCDTLPDAELSRVRDVWNKRPEHRRLAQDAATLLALRHTDIAALKSLATTFRGRQYLFAPKLFTWNEANQTCIAVGGHLATFSTAEENAFAAELCRDRNCAPWVGLRRSADKFLWDNGDVASLNLASSSLSLYNGDQLAIHGVFAGDGWLVGISAGNDRTGFIIEWDHE